LKRKGKNVQFETTREKMIAPGTKEEILDQRCKKKGINIAWFRMIRLDAMDSLRINICCI